MRRTLVIGRTNAGKTLFCVQFARYLGLHEAEWFVERESGITERRRMSLVDAECFWSGADGHRTRGLHSIRLEFPRGKGMRQIILTDTTGLEEGMDADPELRSAMAQTLRAMLEAHVVLHVIDACAVGRALADAGGAVRQAGAWNQLDEQLASFGQTREGYVVLANKMDLPESRIGYQFLCGRLDKRRVLPISARYRTGFREVKHYVWRMA
jgi:hypothetical protein